VPARWIFLREATIFLTALLFAWAGSAADFRPPAGERYAEVGASGTILPGGRVIKPFGIQIDTGPGTLGLAVSPRGVVAATDTGSEMFGVSIIEPPVRAQDAWRARHLWARAPDWTGVTAGVAFDSDQWIWISEGASGRVRQIDAATGEPRKVVSLNADGWTGSFSTDLAYDGIRGWLYVVDRQNARVAVVEARSGRVVTSVRLAEGSQPESEMPFALALSPDGLTAYVTESHEVCVIDVRDALKPRVADRLRAASPEGLLATADRVFVSNAQDDSITVISAADRSVVAEIPLGIPSLGQFRGVLPAGMAYDPVTKRLLVAETGINAVGVVDTTANRLIGLIPAGWMPAKVAISGNRVYVANIRGRGTGPNPRRDILELGETYLLHRGSVSTFLMPNDGEMARQTAAVFSFDGFIPYAREAPKTSAAIRHVVLIVKGNGTFDEVLGDVAKAGNGPVLSLEKNVRFGMHGVARGGRGKFSLQDIPITPNQHEIARRWAFSDNFYADGETQAEGAARVTAKLWDHLRRGGVTFQRFGAEPGAPAPDRVRADQIIAEIDRRYAKGGEPVPRFLCIHLPNDEASDPAPEAGYPFDVSTVLENDFETGRIVDYLSHSPWWRDMTIFITESGTGEGFDHVDAHRTLLFAAGPYVKRNYVSHTNAGFPGLLRTVFELLGLPPSNLADATAASLRDMFTEELDFGVFTAVQPDPRVFDPDKRHQLP
jgi:DNA-binding beta-propeller fold protein YncE